MPVSGDQVFACRRGLRRPEAAASFQAEDAGHTGFASFLRPGLHCVSDPEPFPGALLSTVPEQGGWSLSLEDHRVTGFITLFQCDLSSWVPSTLGVASGTNAQPGLPLVTPLPLPCLPGVTFLQVCPSAVPAVSEIL